MSATIRVKDFESGSMHIDPNDRIRINVTLYPKKTSEEYIVKGSEIHNLNHVWTVHEPLYNVTKVGITVRRLHVFSCDELIGGVAINLSRMDVDRLTKKELRLKSGALNVENARLSVEVTVSSNISARKLAGQSNMLVPIY